MKTIMKLILKILRGVLLAGLLFSIYMLYLYHKEGYQVVLYNMGEGFKIGWTNVPSLYGVGATFCKSATALVLAIPLVVAYWILALIIGDTIRALSVKMVAERKVEKVINDDLIEQIKYERQIEAAKKKVAKKTKDESSEADNGAEEIVLDEPVAATPAKKQADASKVYVGAGAMGRKMLDAKHSEAPDIFEEEVDAAELGGE